MNTNILNKFVATLAALALCLAFVIIVAPLSYAEDTSSVIPHSDAGSSADATDDEIPNQVWNDKVGVPNANGNVQNHPVGLPDGSQGGGIPSDVFASTHYNKKFPSLRGFAEPAAIQSTDTQPMATSGTCQGVTWSGGEATCVVNYHYGQLTINANGVTLSGSVTVGEYLVINVDNGITSLNVNGVVAKDDVSSGLGYLHMDDASGNLTINFSGNSFFDDVSTYDGNLTLSGNGSVTLSDAIGVWNTSSLTINNTGTITGNVDSSSTNAVTISANSHLVGNIFAGGGNVTINGELIGNISVWRNSSTTVTISNTGSVSGNVYLVSGVTFTNNGTLSGIQYGGSGGSPLVKLAKVTNLQATSISYQQTQISWDAVTGALQYNVRSTCTQGGSVYSSNSIVTTNSATVYDEGSVGPVCEPMSVQVTAIYYESNSPEDQGEASDAFTVPYLPYTTASQVRDIKVFYINSNTVKITWSAPLTLGTPVLNNYGFYISASGSSYDTMANCSSLTNVGYGVALTTNTEVVCTNLDDAIGYAFSITPVYFNNSLPESVGGTYVTDNFTFYADGTGLDGATPVNPTQPTTVTKIPIYRAAKYQGGYFYTSSLEEYKSAVNYDMRLESGPNGENPAFYATDANTPGAVPIYRSAKLNGSGYFYTTSESEHATTPQFNMRQEGTDFYVMPASSSLYGEIPVYRGAHLTSHGNGNEGYIYTSNPDEYNNALPANGYRKENEVFRVFAG